MPVTNVHPLNQLLGLNGKSADVTRGYRYWYAANVRSKTKQSIILILQRRMLLVSMGYETIVLYLGLRGHTCERANASELAE